MKMAKIAVITRTKDRTILLKRAIESVLNQTFEDWVMVIVNDGGNPDELEKLVNKYEDAFNGRVLTIHNERSLGMEAASNIGIKATKSKYVVIHDDDDTWRPSFLESCINFLKQNRFPQIKGVITHTSRILERIEGEEIIKESEESFNGWLESITVYRMAAGNVFPPISFVYERAVLDEIGYYREDLPVLGDWEFNLRFIQKYDIGIIPEHLACYHHRLTLKDGAYSNSVVGWHYKHVFYDAMLRNEWLREDMAKGRVGMGFLMNISHSFEKVHGQIQPIEHFLSRLKASGWMRRLGKKFLWGK